MIEERRRNYDVEMAEMKTDIKYIKKSIDENSEQHNEIKEIIRDFVDSVDTKFENLDNKFASKYVERIMWLVISAVVTGFFGALWYLITLLR